MWSTYFPVLQCVIPLVVLYYAGNCVMYRLFITPNNLVKPFAGILYTGFLIIDIISMIAAISIINHLRRFTVLTLGKMSALVGFCVFI